MGTWLIMLMAALGLMVWGRRLTIVDEIYSLAAYAMSILILIFGLVMAPENMALMLGVAALGWLQFRFSKS
ncbi:MAG: hypothetical protein KTR27_08110 [Leptolyngbyaceae cyanobacterium MAG.088]|nr:hypothetical protein [Leptolyngbyaceae cyanobacterium MAG.088]